MTDCAGWPAATSRGGGTGVQAGRGSGRTRGRSSDQGNGRDDGPSGQQLQNLLPTIVAQVGDQGRGQGDGRNQNGNAINDNIQGDVSSYYTYKEFIACNPKEYDGKGGAIVYTRWIEQMESVHDMSGCRDSQRVKYTAGSFVGKALTWWNSKIRTRGREAAVETELWNHAMVGTGHAAYTDRFHELARLVPHLVTPEGKKIERYVYGLALQIRGMVAATEPKTIQKAVQLAGTLTNKAFRNGSIKKNPEKRGNVGEPSKDRNGRKDNKRIRTGNAFATTVNPVRGGYMGTSPKCIACGYHHSPETPCRSCFNYNRLGHFAKDYRVAPRNANPINARNPVARTCFECGSTDHINGSFDVIIGMDWLSDYKAEIIFHEKVVRIPLLDGKVLRVLGEKPEEKIKQLMSDKAKEKKQEKIVVVRDFPEVFPDDLSGLPPVREIEFRIKLVPGGMSVAKSPYRLAPSELEELSGQLKELQDKDMDQDSAHMVAASKVPMLKPENGNTAPKTTVVEGVEKVMPPTTAKKKP
ncbi:hypothetical protein Tco_0945229 [Tanacetum coccineum]